MNGGERHSLAERLQQENAELRAELARARDRGRLAEEIARRLEEVRDSSEHFERCSLTQAASIAREFIDAAPCDVLTRCFHGQRFGNCYDADCNDLYARCVAEAGPASERQEQQP